MKKLNWFIAVIFIVAVFSINSGCEKFRDNREVVTSSNHAVAASSFHDIFRNISLQTSPTGGLVIDPCFNVSWSADSSYPKTLTINFGSTNCEDKYGVTRRGSLTASLSGPYNSQGSVTTVTTNGLYINEYLVEGTMKITNMGLNSSGNQEYEVVVENGAITLIGTEEGKIVSWNCDYKYELIDTKGVDLIFDDIYNITGSVSGVNEEGRDFTGEITETLTQEIICRWPSSGKMEIHPSDLKDRKVDFKVNECVSSTECCDNVAEVCIGHRNYTLRMH